VCNALHDKAIPLAVLLVFPERRESPLLTLAILESRRLGRSRESDVDLHALVDRRRDREALGARRSALMLDLLPVSYDRMG